MTHSDGDVYQGQWKDGKSNGKGTLIDDAGSIYIGDWEDDKQHGVGKEIWDKGALVYIGQFVDSDKTGLGTLTHDNNTYYGYFEHSKFHGDGQYFFGDEDKLYEGEFDDNELTGMGSMTLNHSANGKKDKLIGEFTKGRLNGLATKVYKNGDIYSGPFKNDV